MESAALVFWSGSHFLLAPWLSQNLNELCTKHIKPPIRLLKHNYGRGNDELIDGVDPEQATIAIFIPLEGLVSHVLVGDYAGEQVLCIIDDQMAMLFKRAAD